MRLREISEILEAVLPMLRDLRATEAVSSSEPTARVANQAEVRVALERLSQVPGFSDETRVLLEDPYLMMRDGSPMPDSARGRIDGRIANVRSNAHRLQTVLHAALPSAPEKNTFFVRLPDFESLADLRATIDAIAHVFDVTPRRITGSGSVFSGFDTGSAWLEILTQGTPVASLIITLVKAAYDIREVERKKRDAESTIAQSGDRALQAAVNKALDEHLDEEIKRRAAEAVQAHSKDQAEQHEATNATVIAIREICALLAAGGEVKRALPPMTPTEATEYEPMPPQPANLVGPSRFLLREKINDMNETGDGLQTAAEEETRPGEAGKATGNDDPK